MDRRMNEVLQRAALAGKGALDGIRDAHGPAQAASKLPRVGHALGLLIYAGGAIKGAAGTLRR